MTIILNRKGFSLIELLIVVFIIGILVTLISSNLIGARSKARDAVKKENLRQFVNALRMYYNDYNLYPPIAGEFLGCGTNGKDLCPNDPCKEIEFSAGGTGCSDNNHYLKKFPKEFNPERPEGDVDHDMKYYVSADRLEFRLFIDLENSGDQNIIASQTRCPRSGDFSSITYTTFTYVVCER